MADPDFDPGADLQDSMLGGKPIEPSAPGTFSGIFSMAIPEAIGQQGVYGGALLTHALTNLSSESDEFNGLVEEPAVRDTQFEQRLRATADRMTPAPGTVGTGTQMLMGLAGFATRMAEGGLVAGPVGAVLSTAGTGVYEAHQRALAQGLDEDTAEHIAAVEGVTDGLFAAIPGGAMARDTSLGMRLLQSASIGVASNAGLGMISRYAQHKILADAGYTDLADQYRPFDAVSILTDAAMGIVPAGVHGAAEVLLRRAGVLAAADSRIADAASAVADARASQRRAPGIPVDADSSYAHQDAERTALAQTLHGDAIDLSGRPIAEGASFLQLPQDAEAMADARSTFSQVLAEQLRDSGLDHNDPEVQRVAESLGLELPKFTADEGAPGSESEPIEPAPATLSDTEQTELRRMAGNAGWAEEGGRLIRARDEGQAVGTIGGTAPVTGRTSWVPREPWFQDAMSGRERLRASDRDYPAVVEAGLAGEPLNAQEGRAFTRMSEIARERVADETARRQADVEDIRSKAETAADTPDHINELVALAERAQAVDNDRTRDVLDSWEKDDAQTHARIERELNEIIQGVDRAADEGKVPEGAQGAAGERGSQLPEGGSETGGGRGGEAVTEPLRTATEQRWGNEDRDRHPFAVTGSARGADLEGRQLDLAGQVIDRNPDAMVVGQNGRPMLARDALEAMEELEHQAKAEAAKAINTAVDCAARHL